MEAPNLSYASTGLVQEDAPILKSDDEKKMRIN